MLSRLVAALTVAGIDTDDDVLLSSYPRSGNTWVRFVLANSIRRSEGEGGQVDFADLNAIMPELGRSNLFKRWPYETIPRVVKTHATWNRFFRGMKAVGVVRNPKDVMISYYFYQTGRENVRPEELSQFIRSEEYGISAYVDHFRSWVGRWNYTLHYEDMLSNQESAFRGLFSFLDANVTETVLSVALEWSSRESVKNIEHTRTDDSAFIRSGGKYQRSEILRDRDIRYIDSKLKEVAVPDIERYIVR